jgi:hypothetical protein
MYSSVLTSSLGTSNASATATARGGSPRKIRRCCADRLNPPPHCGLTRHIRGCRRSAINNGKLK